MRKRLASYCAVLCFIICFIICGPTSVSAIWTVDDIADQIQDDLDNMQPSSPAVLHLPSADIQPGYYDVPVVTSIGLDSGSWKFVSGSLTWGCGLLDSSTFGGSYNTLNAGASGNFSTTAATIGSSSYMTGSKSQVVRLSASNAVWRLTTGDSVAQGKYYLSGNIALKLNIRRNGTSNLNVPFTNLTLYDGMDTVIETFTLGDDGYFYPDHPGAELTVANTGVPYFLSTLTFSGSGTTKFKGEGTVSLLLIFDDQLSWTAHEEDPVYNGLLKSILEWLKAIKTGIGNVASSIANLPGLIVDGIKGLFVPSQDALQSLKGNYETLFEGKFGFIYQLYNWVVTFFGDLKTALTSGAAYAFTFPGIAFPMDGETITILDETAVSLDNSAMTVLRPVLGTAVSFIVVIATVNTCRRFILRFLSGHIFGGGGDEV